MEPSGKHWLLTFGVISLVFGLYMWMTAFMTNPPSSPVFNAILVTIFGGVMIVLAWKLKK